MRYGLYAARENMTWEALRSLWEAADRIPLFESAWTFDHLHLFDELLQPTLGGHVRQTLRRVSRWRARDAGLTGSGQCLEGWTSLGALLTTTNRLRGGCLVTGAVYRHPVLLAKMATTLDIVSAGRLEIGLGTGWSPQEDVAYGLGLGSWQDRYDRLHEHVAALVSLMSQPTTTMDGRFVHLHDAPCEPKPVQRPHPPILIAGTSEGRAVPLVARWAQRWQAGFDLDVLPAKLKALHRECAAIGRDPAEISVVMLAHFDGSDRDAFVRRLSRMVSLGVHEVVISVARNDHRLLPRLTGALARVS